MQFTEEDKENSQVLYEDLIAQTSENKPPLYLYTETMKEENINSFDKTMTNFTKNQRKDEEDSNCIICFTEANDYRANTESNMKSFIEQYNNVGIIKEFNESELFCKTITQFSFHSHKKKLPSNAFNKKKIMFHFLIVLIINFAIIFLFFEKYINQVKSRAIESIHQKNLNFTYVYHNYSDFPLIINLI